MNREYIKDISMGTTVVTNKASHNNSQQNVFPEQVERITYTTGATWT